MKVIRKKVRNMKEKMYCYTCDDYVDTIQAKKENTYTIHTQDITLEETCYHCKKCKEELIDETLDTSLNRIYDKYLETYSLSIEKLKKIRNSLNLSQELFAIALGWSKKTITRYELGQSLPQKEYLTVYQKLQDNKDEILNILNRKKEKMDEKNYYNIIKKVNTNIPLKTIHTFLYMLKNNPLYETQIMKHLFAIDFQAQKELNRPISTLRYAHAPYGPIIDGKDMIMNYLLKNNYLELICTNDDKVKFLAIKEYDSNLFTEEEQNILEKVKKKLNGKTSIELSKWSHSFLGWQETKDGQIINYKKYQNHFNLNEGWGK